MGADALREGLVRHLETGDEGGQPPSAVQSRGRSARASRPTARAQRADDSLAVVRVHAVGGARVASLQQRAGRRRAAPVVDALPPRGGARAGTSAGSATSVSAAWNQSPEPPTTTAVPAG